MGPKRFCPSLPTSSSAPSFPFSCWKMHSHSTPFGIANLFLSIHLFLTFCLSFSCLRSFRTLILFILLAISASAPASLTRSTTQFFLSPPPCRQFIIHTPLLRKPHTGLYQSSVLHHLPLDLHKTPTPNPLQTLQQPTRSQLKLFHLHQQANHQKKSRRLLPQKLAGNKLMASLASLRASRQPLLRLLLPLPRATMEVVVPLLVEEVVQPCPPHQRARVSNFLHLLQALNRALLVSLSRRAQLRPFAIPAVPAPHLHRSSRVLSSRLP